MSGIEERLRSAEEIIRAQNRLIQAMYDADLEGSWPREASELQAEYETRYGVNLDGEDVRPEV